MDITLVCVIIQTKTIKWYFHAYATVYNYYAVQGGSNFWSVGETQRVTIQMEVIKQYVQGGKTKYGLPL